MKFSAIVIRSQALIEQAWVLISEARVREARDIGERQVLELQNLLEEHEENDPALLRALVLACHLAGYTVAMSVRNTKALVAASYFEEMQHAAQSLKDAPSIVIALSYQGDMYRRIGELKEALRLLHSAYSIQQPDQAAHGNCAQLLARLYSQMGDIANFMSIMQEAESIALNIDPSRTSLHGQYCLGTVYVDYCKHYSKQGELRKALDYFAKAEQALPPTTHWQTLLVATHGLLLVRSGNLAQGMPYVDKAVQLATNHGNYRLLDHFYGLQRYLGQKSVEFNQATVHLGEALYQALAY